MGEYLSLPCTFMSDISHHKARKVVAKSFFIISRHSASSGYTS